MSKVIKKLTDRDMGHVVQHENGKYYYIDTCYTIDHGCETMVFECEKISEKLFKVDWSEKHMKLHNLWSDMEEYHAWIIEHLEEVDLEEE